MTFEEMFGTELTNKATVFLNKPKEIEDQSEFNSKVGKAIIELFKGGFFQFKEA